MGKLLKEDFNKPVTNCYRLKLQANNKKCVKLILLTLRQFFILLANYIKLCYNLFLEQTK